MNILDIFYPPRCLHCWEKMSCHKRLCSVCLSHFNLLPVEGHCLKCGKMIPHISGVCIECRNLSHKLKQLGVCFDVLGPASSLVKLFFQTHHPKLVREIASLMIIQMEALGFGEIDIVTMVPNAFFNPQYAVARFIAKALNVPFVPAIRRVLKPEVDFELRRCNLIHKRLLVIDLITSSRFPIKKAAEVLSRGWPRFQYGLTFCATC